MSHYKRNTPLQAALVDILNECKRMRGRNGKPLGIQRLALLANVNESSLYRSLNADENATSSDKLLHVIQTLGFDIEIVVTERKVSREQTEAFYGPRRTLAERIIASEPGIRRSGQTLLAQVGNTIRFRVQSASTVAGARAHPKPATSNNE